MTAEDITASCTFRVGFDGDLKVLSIVTPSDTESGDWIDLGSDTVGARMNTILNTLVQDDVGADYDSTWVPSTGVITLGTIVQGIHNVTVWGI